MMTHEWIDVDERLPQRSERVLVAFLGRVDRKPGVCTETLICAAGGWWTAAGQKYGGAVTHWMPLPEAPAERAPKART